MIIIARTAPDPTATRTKGGGNVEGSVTLRGMQRLELDWEPYSARDQGPTVEIEIEVDLKSLDLDDSRPTGRTKSTRSMDTIQAGKVVDGETDS